MRDYIVRRFLLMIVTLFAVSIVSFVVIQLPPGDFIAYYISQVNPGETVSSEIRDAMRERYGLDQPVYVQYLKWMRGVLQGDLGQSFLWNKPVRALIGERIMLTIAVSLSTLIISWLLALPIGIYSAVRQYSIADYTFTGMAFLGVAIPEFLIALAMLWIGWEFFGANLSGLFSAAYVTAPWSLAKLVDLLKHLWVPLVILGTGGIAYQVRILRATLLDELRKPYVVAARSRGLTERAILLKYPLRIALSPFISTIGWALPGLISGTTIVSIVLALPTAGPLLLDALKAQDMLLAGSFVLILSCLTVIGTFLSDLLLVIADPRIRFE